MLRHRLANALRRHEHIAVRGEPSIRNSLPKRVPPVSDLRLNRDNPRRDEDTLEGSCYSTVSCLSEEEGLLKII